MAYNADSRDSCRIEAGSDAHGINLWIGKRDHYVYQDMHMYQRLYRVGRPFVRHVLLQLYMQVVQLYMQVVRACLGLCNYSASLPAKGTLQKNIQQNMANDRTPRSVE